RPCARRLLVVQQRTAARASAAAYAGPVSRVPRGARRSRAAARMEDLPVERAGAHLADAVLLAIRPSSGPHRRRDEQGREGLARRTLGRGLRCALERLRTATRARRRPLAARSGSRAHHLRAREGEARLRTRRRRPAWTRRDHREERAG